MNTKSLTLIELIIVITIILILNAGREITVRNDLKLKITGKAFALALK